MDRRRATLGAAAIGVVAGAVALGLVASPAGAGQSPTLPSTTPQALIQSVLTSSMPAMAGTVQVDNNLGLPPIPGLPKALTGGDQIRVWTDGKNRSRIAIPSNNGEQTVVDNGTTMYEWNSADRSVVEHSLHNAKQDTKKPDAGQERDLNPSTAAKDMVTLVQQTSTISVDGTDMVANRPAYDLVLTPKPSERTLLREVKIAVDSQTRLPLRVTVLAENTDTPALQIGFSSIDFGAQDPSLFQFAPPADATVTNGDKAINHSTEIANSIAPKFVGKGWDTVIVAKAPMLSGAPDAAGDSGSSGIAGSSSRSSDMFGLISQFGTAVHGNWGSGWVISTDVGTALITSDGRIAAGFVPQQVLFQALGSGK